MAALQPPSPAPSTIGAGSKSDNHLALEKQLAVLQEKYDALEQKYTNLHGKDHTLTKNSIGRSAEVSFPQVSPPSTPSTPGPGLARANSISRSEEQDTGPKSRARVVLSKSNPNTGEREDLPSTKLPKDPPPPSTTYAFTLRKNVEQEPDDNDGEIDIASPHLWNLMKQVLGHCPTHTFQGTPTTLSSPYKHLVLNWEKLEKAAQETPKDEEDKQARMDLQLLLDTVFDGSGEPSLDKYFKIRDALKERKSVTFETLWTIFPPGTLVYGKPFLGQDGLFIVQDHFSTWPSRKGNWGLRCWAYDWDAKEFKRRAFYLNFERFTDSKPITSLSYYPFELHEQKPAMKEKLIARGRKYREFCTARQGLRMFDYEGDIVFGKKGFTGVQGVDNRDDETISTSFDSSSEYGRKKSAPTDTTDAMKKSTIVESRVMVDFESYFQYGPGNAPIGLLTSQGDSDECTCMKCEQNDALKSNYRSRFDEDTNQTEWEEEQYMLCPPRVLGYVLRDKQWAQLEVEALKPILRMDPKDSWSQRLKLADGEETKDMILKLVKGHTGNADSSDDDNSRLEIDDIVAKKGKGLVILLYGPPGVGKTSTAETVAVAARKPLFSISVADVGIEAKNVEANLATIFALASSWQAILLIDEADVFLESRARGIGSNTERNALVSVFLRVLEYYQGILMLTTNQIAQFDVAVQSRVHIAIKYGSLSQAQTMAIFEEFLSPLAQNGRVKDMDQIREWLKDEVCRVGLDGRQIRNVLTSALGLARAEGKSRLEKKDIKKILLHTRDFKDDFVKQFERYKNDQQGLVG